MPTVPITGERPQLLTGRGPSPSETEILMALAEMNAKGRIPGPTIKAPDPNAQRSTNRRSPSPLR